jgi:hypothetical protein
MSQARNDFSIEGMDELLKAFAKLPAEAMQNLIPAVDNGGVVLMFNTKKHLPDGPLKRSLYIKKGKNADGVYTNVLTWHDDVRAYAAPYELGHKIRRVKKGPILGEVDEHPYLRPGADESEQPIKNGIIEAMNKTTNEMGGKK